MSRQLGRLAGSMTTAHGVAMLGTGLIGDFYTATLHGQRGRDRVQVVSSRIDAMAEGREPAETFYDGYVVNAVMDACYLSVRTRAWEPVALDWRGGSTPRVARQSGIEDGLVVVKEEQLLDGRRKLILSDPATSRIVDRIV